MEYSVAHAIIASVMLVAYIIVGVTNNLDSEFIPSLAHPSLALAIVAVMIGALLTFAFFQKSSPPVLLEPVKQEENEEKKKTRTKGPRPAPVTKKLPENLVNEVQQDPAKTTQRRAAARSRRRANQKTRGPDHVWDEAEELTHAQSAQSVDQSAAVGNKAVAPEDIDPDQPKNWEVGLYDEYGNALDGPWMQHYIPHTVKAEAGSDDESEVFKHAFMVDSTIASALIGPKGANIKQAEAIRGVRVQIENNHCSIVADSQEGLDEALAIMSFEKSSLSLEHGWMYGWLLGNKGAVIKQLEQAASVRAKVNGTQPARDDPTGKDDRQLVLIGRSSGLEDAERWLAANLAQSTMQLSETVLGWLLANKGTNIRSVEEQTGVCRILVNREDPANMSATLYGPQHALQLAEELIRTNTFHAFHPLQSPHQLSWLKGNKEKMKQLNEIQGLWRAELLTEENAVLLSGKQQAVMAANQFLSVEVPTPDAFSVANFSVAPSVIGLMLGKKGSRVQAVTEDPQVYSVDVGEEGAVVVLGSCPEAVNRAKRTLELFSETVPISKAQLRALLNNKATMLKSMEESCELLRSNIEKLENGAGNMELVGSASAVIKAQVFMNEQLYEETVKLSDLCVNWLLEDKAKVVQELEGSSGLAALQVESETLELSMVGLRDALATCRQELASNSQELHLRVDEPGALSLLLKNKAASLKALKKTTGLGKASLDREECELKLLGQQSALEAAREWLWTHTKLDRIELRPGFMRWLVGKRGMSLRTRMQALESAAGGAVSLELDQPENTIEVTGTDEAIENVRKWIAKNLHHTIEAVQILASESGYIIGKKGANVKEMIKLTGIDSADIDDDTTILLTGTRETVEKAVVYLEIQSEYHGRIHEVEEQISELKAALAVLPRLRKVEKVKAKKTKAKKTKTNDDKEDDADADAEDEEEAEEEAEEEQAEEEEEEAEAEEEEEEAEEEGEAEDEEEEEAEEEEEEDAEEEAEDEEEEYEEEEEVEEEEEYEEEEEEYEEEVEEDDEE